MSGVTWRRCSFRYTAPSHVNINLLETYARNSSLWAGRYPS